MEPLKKKLGLNMIYLYSDNVEIKNYQAYFSSIKRKATGYNSEQKYSTMENILQQIED